MTPTIRALRAADARTLALIEAAAWTQAYRDLLPAEALRRLVPHHLEKVWRQRLHGAPPGAWGIELEGMVVGYCIVRPAQEEDLGQAFAGEVAELYVHPGWQGRGLGRALLGHALTAMRAARLRWAVLWVLEGNLPARAFYASAGLEPDGHRRRIPVPGGRAPALRYAVNLAPLDLAGLLSERADR